VDSIRILIADDHRIVREGIRTLLANEHDIEVIAEAENGREALKLAVEFEPDITIMDIGMPELNGIEAIKQIRKKIPNARIIVLSMHSEHEFIWKTFNSGAFAYLLKDCAAEELVTAIRRVNGGKKYISEDISEMVLQDFVESKWRDTETTFVPLSEREKEVLQLLSEGKSIKAIAKTLFIGNKTVESHRKNIMEKLQLFSLPELTKYAIRSGLTSLG